MNLHLIGETLFLLAAALVKVPEKPLKAVVVTTAVVFLTVVFYQMAITGMSMYFNTADVTECTIMTLVFGYLLFRTMTESRNSKYKTPVILACTGIVVYFACSVPLVALLHVIQQRDPKTNDFLFFVINDVVANLRYLFLALAFWLTQRSGGLKVQ